LRVVDCIKVESVWQEIDWLVCCVIEGRVRLCCVCEGRRVQARGHLEVGEALESVSPRGRFAARCCVKVELSDVTTSRSRAQTNTI